MSYQSRRQFLQRMGIGAAAISMSGLPLTAAEPGGKNDTSLTFGLITDVHYGDSDTRGSRHYRDSLKKLAAAVEEFRRQEVAFVAELGDLINAGPSKETELEYLETVYGVLKPLDVPKHFVLGNHCVDTLTKAEFLKGCGRDRSPTYYSFDVKGYHFVVLDADFLEDGTSYAAGNFQWTDTWIPKEEQDWLQGDLAKSKGRPTIVFIHQNLHDEKDVHGVKNAPEVRKILEASGDVIAVFQGHMHSGGLVTVGGIPYCTLRAMVEGPGMENNAFAVVKIRGQKVEFNGFGEQRDWPLP